MEIRSLIDEAKRRAAALDDQMVEVDTLNGMGRRQPRSKAPTYGESKEIDPSNVSVASDGDLTATLVAQLHELRASIRLLQDQDKAIKSVLLEMTGELEYLSLNEGETPVVSLKHESSVRVNSARVRELLPPEEHPDVYTNVSSRPLRLM